ncbi:MAG: DbpA RNA binding domain-containing protein, partial [Spirochaetales bacterium]|nr:DbpA RNA binding domain-containing protein [Spirochaetales bacterium]
MSSHSILPAARRAAIEAAFDEALADVRAAGDVALLQECRAIFRQRVPLHLRAYVAAALVLNGSPATTRAPQNKDKAKQQLPRNARKGETGSLGTQSAPERARDKKARPGSAGEQRGESASREPRETREKRYRGEGVTLFVSAGRRQRFYSRIAVKLLLEIPGVADESIGDIRTMDNYSFIVVDPAVEDAVLATLNGYDFKGRIIAANRA